jgi:hemolysin activation/secretion protein
MLLPRKISDNLTSLLVGIFVIGFQPVASIAETPILDRAPEQEEEAAPQFYIRHYKIIGASKLPKIDVEQAVYPFMGPNCTAANVESARKALEQAYYASGYKTVTVSLPAQDPSLGIIKLEVHEGGVQRLRVRGARYFDPTKIAAKAGSLREGVVPNFNEVTKDIVALNKNGDAIVLPKLVPTGEPGEFDVNLNVKDKLPLHGTVELNNRNSPDTTELRVNAGLSYSNLWQLGHTIGGNAQVAPERPDDALVYSGYYIMPVGDDGVNLMMMGTKQDSDISTLGGAAVKGKGYVLGARLNFPLPGTNSWKKGEKEGDDPEWTPDNFFHSLSLGVDYKHFTEDLALGENTKFTPIDYFPVSLSYGASWVEKQHSTEFNTTFTAGTRGFGSDMQEFDNKRYLATGGFFHVKSDLSHTHDVGKAGQVFGKVQGQWANQPLVNNEQFSGGGLGNARGYLESTVLGDNAIFATLEARTPNILANFKKKPAPPAGSEQTEDETDKKTYEWRLHAFVDGGLLSLNEPLPEQDDSFSLLSVGVGTRFNLNQTLQGSLDAGFPLRKSGTTDRGDWLLTFRMWTAF